MSLVIEQLRCSYGSRRILDGVSLHDIPTGSMTALVGPNAAGKTTLLKCIAGLLVYDGGIRLNERELRGMKREDRTRTVSYLPQEVGVHAALTVFEAVLLAKQQAFTWRASDADLDLVSDLLEVLEIDDLAMRYLNELSGGQRQLVSIAQALVRRSAVLLLDEPTSNLDLQRQIEVLSLVQRYAAEHDTTAIVTMHDLNLASRCAEHVVVLHAGGVYAAGRPTDVMTAEMLRDVYGVRGHVASSGDGVPHLHVIESIRNPGGSGVLFQAR